MTVPWCDVATSAAIRALQQLLEPGLAAHSGKVVIRRQVFRADVSEGQQPPQRRRRVGRPPAPRRSARKVVAHVAALREQPQRLGLRSRPSRVVLQHLAIQ